MQGHEQDLKLFHRVLKQTQKDSNKIYSLHEPEVRCIAKGKEAKKYEFGNKVSIATTGGEAYRKACQNFHGTVVHYINIKIWSWENRRVFQA